MRKTWAIGSSLIALIAASVVVVLPLPAIAEPCGMAATASLYGTDNVATVAGQAEQDVVPVNFNR
jgi:hypothetical protein